MFVSEAREIHSAGVRSRNNLVYFFQKHGAQNELVLGATTQSACVRCKNTLPPTEWRIHLLLLEAESNILRVPKVRIYFSCVRSKKNIVEFC